MSLWLCINDIKIQCFSKCKFIGELPKVNTEPVVSVLELTIAWLLTVQLKSQLQDILVLNLLLTEFLSDLSLQQGFLLNLVIPTE